MMLVCQALFSAQFCQSQPYEVDCPHYSEEETEIKRSYSPNVAQLVKGWSRSLNPGSLPQGPLMDHYATQKL